MKKTLVALTLSLACLAACTVSADQSAFSNFSECVAAGNKVLRTYPARCVTADGQTFVDQEATPLAPPAPVGGDKKICLDMCGNGSCEMIVCMGSNCPCAESHTTCPSDCNE